MKVEFQEEVLRYLSQAKESKRYIEIVDSDFFELPNFQIAYDLLKGYVKHYGSLPSEAGLVQYFDIEATKKNLSKDVYNTIEGTIREMYAALQTNTQQIRDSLIQYYQQKLAKDFVKEYSAQVKGGDKALFDAMHQSMKRIAKLGEEELEDENNRGEFLLADHKIGGFKQIDAHPIFLKGVNKMTSAKGFHKPQLIIILGGPKSFKTGVLLNIGIGYVRDGLKVYYADAENGLDSIRARANQAMLQCSYDELIGGDNDDTLNEMVKRYKVMGGDFKNDFFPGYTKSLADVDDELTYLRDEFNWVPDVILYDYLDLFLPRDKKIQEERHKLTAVYFDAIWLHNKWGMFGISPSQVSKAALDKKVLDLKAFAGDFRKAANCHAAFAICQDPTEEECGVARIVPVVQRAGKPYAGRNVCFVQLDKAKMLVKEISMTEAHGLLPDEDDKKKRDGKVKPGEKRAPAIHKRSKESVLKNVQDK